jgi:hypothetical protein
MNRVLEAEGGESIQAVQELTKAGSWIFQRGVSPPRGGETIERWDTPIGHLSSILSSAPEERRSVPTVFSCRLDIENLSWMCGAPERPNRSTI